MNKISLTGQWNVSWTDGDHGSGEDYLRPLSDAGRYMTLSFPGSLQSRLEEAGLVDDPRIGMNYLKARWVEEKCWILRRTFVLPAEAAEQPAYLHIDVLDGVAKVAVNGQMIGEHANAFRPAEFCLTGKLRAGVNEISILLESGLFKVANLPGSDYLQSLETTLTKRFHLRQAQYQFGWDWNPRLIFFGLHGAIDLLWGQMPWIRQVSVLAEVAADLGSACIRVKPLIEWTGDQPLTVELHLTSLDGLERTVSTRLVPGECEPEIVLEVPQPRLWWPRGYGEAFLYPLDLRITADGQEMAAWQGRTGLRRVEIQQPAHPEVGRYFHLVINNQPVFCKGANWVPPELSAHEVSPERVKRLVELAEEENMNTLRLWGGGVWANHTLLNLCDERGFILWHDLLFACAKYPADRPEFLHEVEREVSWGIREFSPHPSLMVWCGNNEMEAGLWEWGYKNFGRSAPDLVLFHHAIPILMARLDPTRPYWPSSPYSSTTVTPSDPTVGDQHQWSVSLGPDDVNFWAYRQYVDRFPNEGGVLGCAPLASLSRFLNERELQARSFAWEAHDNSIVFGKSQPGFTYRSIEHWLGKPADSLDVEMYTLASGLLQAEGLKEYILNYRRRWPSSSSAIYWMFNDSWPTVHGWPTFDYYLNRKPAFFPVRRAFADQIVVLADEGEQIGVYVVNDTRSPLQARVNSGDFSPESPTRANPLIECVVPAFTSLRVLSLSRDPLRITYAVLEDGAGHKLAQDRLLLRPFGEWQVPSAHITVDTVEREGQRLARYQSDFWVWNVVLDLSGEAALQDDVFDLLPGIPYEVPLAPDQQPLPVAATGNQLLA